MTSQQIAYWKVMNERASVAETQRHNIVYEAETQRHNVETERQNSLGLAETARHNVAQEGISSANVQLGYAQLGETTRHNQTLEGIQKLEARANVFYTNAQTDYTLSRTKGQDISNEWAPTLNGVRVATDITDSVSGVISSVGKTAGLFVAMG